MTFLLDVNVLIALIDPSHVAHEDAHQWFAKVGHRAWATCPLTENSAMRIIGHPNYPNFPGSPATVAAILREMRKLSGHHFWADDVSLVSTETIDPAKILTSAQVTDTYLLALAKAHGAWLATFDRRLSVAAVSGGRSTLFPIVTGASDSA